MCKNFFFTIVCLLIQAAEICFMCIVSVNVVECIIVVYKTRMFTALYVVIICLSHIYITAKHKLRHFIPNIYNALSAITRLSQSYF